MTLAYSPFSIWPAALICLTISIAMLNLPQIKRPFLLGWLFGIGWFGAGISWVHVSISQFGGLPLVGSIGLMVLLCGYLALYPALAFYLTKRFFSANTWPLSMPLLWLFSEWLRSWMLTGFPWLSIGYSQLHSPLAGWMPVIGEFGLSGLLILTCSAIAVWLPIRRYVAGITLVAIMLISGWTLNQYQWTKPSGEKTSIAMVQGNIKQELRWVPEQDRPTMEKYLRMTQMHWQNDLIIWPEAAVPKLEPIAQDYLAALDATAANHNVGLITGIVNYNFETNEAYNSLIGLGSKLPEDNQGHYRYLHSNRFYKHHLLPIGEYIPLESWIRGLAPIFDLPMSSFNRGGYQQENLQVKGINLAPAICFEIAFPNQIRANLYDNTDFIITVSNDAWFDGSHGPDQHLEIAQVRAKEFGLPVLRATNTGITAFIDHNGKIQSRLPQQQAGVLSDSLDKVTGTTIYRVFGDTLAWILAIIGCVFGLYFRKPVN